MASESHLPAAPAPRMIAGFRSAMRFLGPPECHDDDQELLAVMRHLKAGNPPSPRAWQVLAMAASRGDLFVVSRAAGDSLDCLARLQRRKT